MIYHLQKYISGRAFLLWWVSATVLGASYVLFASYLREIKKIVLLFETYFIDFGWILSILYLSYHYFPKKVEKKIQRQVFLWGSFTISVLGILVALTNFGDIISEWLDDIAFVPADDPLSRLLRNF